MEKIADVKELMDLVEKYAEDYRAVDGWSGKVLSSSILNKAYASKDRLENALQNLVNNQKEETATETKKIKP